MPQRWKDFQITAGSLVAFVMGLLATGATLSGVQSWVDDRVAERLAPIERRLSTLESAYEMEQERSAEIRRILNEILDQMKGETDER